MKASMKIYPGKSVNMLVGGTAFQTVINKICDRMGEIENKP